MKKQLIISYLTMFLLGVSIISASQVFAQQTQPGQAKSAEKVVREIKQLIGDMEGIRLRTVGERPLIEGQPLSWSDKKRLDKILRVYPQIINLLDNRVEKPMIGIEVTILAINLKSEKPNLLAKPRFSIADGDTAFFFSGGELPFAASDGLTANWKKYGIRLKIIPYLLSGDRIFLEIEAETSQPDPSISTKFGVPALQTCSVKNNGVVKPGQPVILAGLYQVDEITRSKRIPILGHILPFIFSYKKRVKQKRELMILVTPHVPPDFKGSDFKLLRMPE